MTIVVAAAVGAVMMWSRRTAPDGARARLGWYELFFLFISSAFLGDLFETVFVYLRTGVLMSRSSLLYAPLSLVWGLGAVLMTLVLTPLALLACRRAREIRQFVSDVAVYLRSAVLAMLLA